MEHKCWKDCPSVILIDVFKSLDLTTLVTCMHVSKKWRDIAHHVVKACGLWQKIVEQTTMDDGLSYRRKSKLEWNEIYDNSLLWHFTEKAKIIVKSVTCETVKNVHVYKDNLIIVCDDNVKYFNIETLELRKEISIKCDGYEESDHIIIISTKATGDNRYLCNLLVDIYSKKEPDDPPELEEFPRIIKEVLIYKLQGDRCCFIDKLNRIFITLWDAVECKLVHKCLGCTSIIQTLHMYRNELYVMRKSGAVYQYDTTKMGVLGKIFAFCIPPEAVGNQLFMFHKHSAVIRVSPVNYFNVNRGENFDNILLECPALSCAMEHGNILLLGYSDGRIYIVNPNKFSSNGGLPELELHVQDMDPSIEQPEILWLDVYETNYVHYLVIGIRCRVFLAIMKYPQHIYCDGFLRDSLV